MENPTVPHHFQRLTSSPSIRVRPRQRVQPSADAVVARVWLAVNLVAIASFSQLIDFAANAVTFSAWASFTLLNASLIAVNRGVMRRSKPIRTADTSGRLYRSDSGFWLAAIAGASWGAAVLMLLPHTPSANSTMLLAVVLIVAVAALPIFSAQPGSYRVYLGVEAVLIASALLSAEFGGWSLGWLAFAVVSLILLGHAFQRSHHGLRRTVSALLSPLAAAEVYRNIEELDDQALSELATKNLKALNQLGLNNDLRRRILASMGDAVIATNRDGSIAYVNPVAEVLLGRSGAELKGRALEDGMRIVCQPDSRNRSREIFDTLLSSNRSQHSNDHSELVRSDGVVYGLDYHTTAIHDREGEFDGAVFLLRDVTEKRHHTKTLTWQATHDPLTHSVNRTEFEIRLKKLMRRASDSQQDVHALLYIDIDNFKFVNDSYGHPAGDAILKSLADVLRTRVRGADTLARIGGDEFGALLYSCSGEKARLIADGLRLAVERHEFSCQSIDVPISLSIGVVEINKKCSSLADLLRAADTACYTAKQYGRNRVHVFEPTEVLEIKHARVFDFVKDIQTAIHGNRLELFYRPMVTATDGKPSGQYELNVGIRNTDGELIPQTELEALANRYHLIEEIDRWAVKAALDALSLNHPNLRDADLVLVPLSQQSINDDRLLEYLLQQLKENPGQAERIGFAVQLCELQSDIDALRYFVTALKQQGCQFMVSDAAFGQHSIELLESLQADFFGIRGELIQRMLHSSVDYELVLGLTRIAHTLGMKTIAGDADTQSQREAVAKMGIDYATGELGQHARALSIYSDAQWI